MYYYVTHGRILMFNNVEWIFFDVGSTLMDESKAYEHRIKAMAEEANVSYDEIYHRMMEFYRQNKKGDLEVARELGIDKPKWNLEDEKLYPETEHCLKELSAKYNIGIIANQSLRTADRLKEKGILKYIDLVIASAEEGVSKPDLRIFNIALERAHCLAENAVMVGDRLDNDIAPAKKLGMKTIWIKQGFGRFSVPGSKEECADLIVENLQEIISG